MTATAARSAEPRAAVAPAAHRRPRSWTGRAIVTAVTLVELVWLASLAYSAYWLLT